MLTQINVGRPLHGERQPFDLRDLLTGKNIRALIETGMSVYDSSLHLIAGHVLTRLCESAPASEREQCAHCGIRTVRAVPEQGQWFDCAPGVQMFLRPVVVHGKPIGFLGSGQIGLGSGDRSTLEAKVGNRVTALQTAMGERRCRKIVGKFRRDARQAATQSEIRDILTETAANLFRSVSSVYFSTLRGNTIHLEHPQEELLANSIRKDEGHVGLVYERGHSHYEPNLTEKETYFKRDNDAVLPRTVFTVLTRWGWEDLPGTVQVQSFELDACPELSERKAFEKLAAWAGSQSVKLALREELRKARLRQTESTGWREQVLDVLLGRDQDLTTVLRTKRAVVRQFAEELKRLGETACIEACVRGYNPLSKEVAYVVCVGDAWTPEARETLYNVRVASAGRKALESPVAVYYADIGKVKDVTRILEHTISLWTKRFTVRGVVRGVVSLSWNVEDACPPEMQATLESIVVQFEAILDAIAALEEVLFRQLETAVLHQNQDDLHRMSQTLAAIFDARHCSLFTDRYGEKKLTLYATSHLSSAPNIDTRTYAFGDGITGWVAEHRKPVSLQNPGDPAELDHVARRHGVPEPILHTRPLPQTVPPGEIGVLAAPLVARDRVIGVIRLGSVPRDAFGHEAYDHEAEAFLMEIANRLAHEFDRVWIEEDANVKLRQLEHKAGFDEAHRRAADFNDAVIAALEEAIFSAGADGAYIRIDDHQGDIQSTQAAGILKSLRGEQYEFPLVVKPNFSADIWEADCWNSLKSGLEQSFGPQAKELVHSGAFVKLLAEDLGVLATLGLCFRVPPAWHDRPDTVLVDLGERASTAIRAALRLARVEKKLRGEIDSRERLRELGLAYALTTSPSQVAEEVLRSALKQTGLEFGVVRLYDEQQDTWARAAPPDNRDKDDDRFPSELHTNKVLERCKQSKKPILRDDIENDPQWLADWQDLDEGRRKEFLRQVKSWIGVPMWLQDEFLGAIILLSTKRVPFSPETLPRLEILSHYAATAIYSAENQARQLKTAEPFALVGTMLGGFLHTMRNELTGAKGFWDNLNNMSLPEPARERLDNLGKALRATSQICQDLVTFDPMARPTTEKIPLNDLLDETWLNLSRGGRIHGVTIKTLYAPTKPVILGNRVQIETAIRMLLQNSMEALAEVGPRKDERSIRLQTQVKAKCVILRIADSGPGMSEETRRQAFRPFFTTKPTGNGLGLAVVWHVAKRHKARIKLVTRAGWGTSVSLFFPREVLD